MMEIDKETKILEKPTNMEVDEERDNVREISVAPEAGLFKEIKKEPVDEDEVRKKLKELDEDVQSKVSKKPEGQNVDMQLKIKTEPVEEDVEMRPEIREELKEQGEDIQSEERKEPEEQDVDMQPEVGEKSNEQEGDMQSKQPEVGEKSNEQGGDMQSKQPEEQDVDMRPEVREKSNEQGDMQSKEPKEQDVDTQPEVTEKLNEQEGDMQSKEPKEQDVDMQPDMRKESEKQDNNVQSDVRKEPESKEENMQIKVKKEPEEKEKNTLFKIKKEPKDHDENMQQEITKEPKEHDKNMSHEINKRLGEQENNKQSKESEEQDQEMQLEVRKEPENQEEKMQLEDSEEPKVQNENMQSQVKNDSEKQDEKVLPEVRKESERGDEKMLPEARKESEDKDKIDKLKINILRDDHSVKTNEDSSKSSGTTEPDLKEIIRLSAGASIKDDNEEVIHLTAEEVKQYLLKKIAEYMNSSVNPLFTLRAKAKEIEEKGKAQVEEYCKLYKGLQLLQRKHENFLRNVDILPKVTMCHVNVSADLPMETVPNPEALLKKELSITKVDNPINKSAPVPSAQSKIPTAPVAKSSSIECIDLTDESDPSPATTIKSPNYPVSVLKHPAPLPPRPFTTNVKRVPPKPRLKISAEDRGIVLQWDMPNNPRSNPTFDPIATFEIFGYQEQKNSVINTSLWKKIGSVKSMSLPMACTLTQFVDGNKYHFAIRAVDANGLCGNYSDAISIIYKQRTPK